MTAAAFADPALGAQTVFRALLNALAHPGTEGRIEGAPSAPAGMGRGFYAAILALGDFETTIWLDPELAGARDDLRFQLGAKLTDAPARADFALIVDGASMPTLDAFAQGDTDYPDRSTTLLIEVAALSGDGPWRLRGPGIANEARLGVEGLPNDFLEQWRANHARFPRGVDTFLFAGTTAVGLPRTTAIREG